jgi:hypothetical protein
MQVPLLGDYKHMVRPYIQFFGYQFHGHSGVARQNLVQHGSYCSQVVNDNNGYPQIGGQIAEQPGIGIEAASRTSYANYGKIHNAALSFHLIHF